MSGLLALVGPAADRIGDEEARDRLASMAHRGHEEVTLHRLPGALLSVARDRWEAAPGFAGPTAVASRGPFHAVADASLYYVRDLEARLAAAGVPAVGQSAADLVVAAYAAFGAECVRHLEGDYAFCLWDERDRVLFCGRDAFGARSLFYREIADGVVVSSTPHPLLHGLDRRAALDPLGVTRALLMRYGNGSPTPWKDVRELPAGSSLSTRGRGTSTAAFWTASGSDRWRDLDATESVEAFAALLDAAAQERGRPGCSLALSGGQDSTGILASLGLPAPPEAPVHLLSFGLAENDPGNESWYVRRVAEAFGLPVHWVETEGIGFFAGAETWGRTRSHCHGFIFEGHNRALARSARELGSRVVLSGHGGDNVCGVGDWEMVDLLRSARLVRLRRFMRARGYRGSRQFLQHCLRPALPLWVLDALEPALGRHICSRPYERPVPPWMTVERERIASLTRDDRRDYGRRIAGPQPTYAGAQRAWLLQDACFARGCAMLYDLNREEGVEMRMPFYDTRLVEFALSRPPAEFSQPRQNKVLLRRAMAGRLPDRSREPQRGGLKPGTAIGVLEARWRPEVVAFAAELGSRPWIAQELGVMDQERFAAAVGRPGGPDLRAVVDVSLTPLVEAWLRANT